MTWQRITQNVRIRSSYPGSLTVLVVLAFYCFYNFSSLTILKDVVLQRQQQEQFWAALPVVSLSHEKNSTDDTATTSHVHSTQPGTVSSSSNTSAPTSTIMNSKIQTITATRDFRNVLQPKLSALDASSLIQTTNKTSTKLSHRHGNLTSASKIPISRVNPTSCLNPNGPIPVILMVHGRSGSSATWQSLSALTGYETKARELTGPYRHVALDFFNNMESNRKNGQWALQYLCQQQARAGGTPATTDTRLVGFQWKPFIETMELPEAQQTLQLLGQLATNTIAATTVTTNSSTITSSSNNPSVGIQGTLVQPTTGTPIRVSSSSMIRVVRSRRNPLDVKLSHFKHKQQKLSNQGVLKPHCSVDQQMCINRHSRAGMGMKIDNVTGFVHDIQQLYEAENKVDEMLRQYHIPTVFVSYDKLFHPEEETQDGQQSPQNGTTVEDLDPLLAEEWNKVFRFLQSPKQNWTWQEIRQSITHADTAPSRSHKDIISNYEEVFQAFQGTGMEFFLRP